MSNGCAFPIPKVFLHPSCGIPPHKEMNTGTRYTSSGTTNNKKNISNIIRLTSIININNMAKNYRIQLSIDNKRKFHRFLKMLNVYPNFYFNFAHSRWTKTLTDNCLSTCIDDAFLWDDTKEHHWFWSLIDSIWRQAFQEINMYTAIYLRTNIQQLQECRNRAAK